MKLTILLIPLLFLSSCTIDWNDEKTTELEQSKTILMNDLEAKNTKITELESQIQTLHTEAKINTPKISLSPTNTPKYANLLVGKYEGGDSHLIDMEQGKILFEIPSGEAKKVTENGTTLTVLIAGIYAPNMLYTYHTGKGEIISKENIDDQSYTSDTLVEGKNKDEVLVPNSVGQISIETLSNTGVIWQEGMYGFTLNNIGEYTYLVYKNRGIKFLKYTSFRSNISGNSIILNADDKIILVTTNEQQGSVLFVLDKELTKVHKSWTENLIDITDVEYKNGEILISYRNGTEKKNYTLPLE